MIKPTARPQAMPDEFAVELAGASPIHWYSASISLCAAPRRPQFHRYITRSLLIGGCRQCA